MLLFYENILNDLENGKNIDIVYLDYEKAFDKVDIGILCHRLKEKKIYGKMGIWIHNFLCDRSQRILANGDISDESSIISGVPQGTVLGPLLFLILIDSLGDIDMDALVASFCI